MVFVQKSDGWGKGIVKDLADAGVAVVVLPASVPGGRDPQIVPAFREAGIPVIAAGEAGVQVKGKKGLAAKEQFEGALSRWKEEQARFVREKASDKIEHMFKEYKSERGKEVKKGGGRSNGRP